jgi:hypothetical protein
MAHGADIKNQVRDSYVNGLLALSVAAVSHGVPKAPHILLTVERVTQERESMCVCMCGCVGVWVCKQGYGQDSVESKGRWTEVSYTPHHTTLTH